MALAGKELGKDVGQWFGPSTAAGAIKCVNDDTLLISSYINLSSGPSFITSQKRRSVSLLPSTARSSRATYIQPRSHQQVHLDPASFQDGADVQSLSLLVFGLELTVSTPSIMTRLRCVDVFAFTCFRPLQSIKLYNLAGEYPTVINSLATALGTTLAAPGGGGECARSLEAAAIEIIRHYERVGCAPGRARDAVVKLLRVREALDAKAEGRADRALEVGVLFATLYTC